MAGRAEIEYQDTLILKNVWLLNDQNRWESARNPLNRYSSVRKDISMQKLGPGYAFAKKLSELNPDIQIGLVVNARGGTSIGQWAPDSSLYNKAIRRTRLAIAQGGVLKGILWNQGGSDRKRPEHYFTKLEHLIYRFRSDFNNDSLAFVVGQIGSFRTNSDEINQIFSDVSKKICNTGCASDEGVTHLSDNTHFDSVGQRMMGERYAIEIDRIVYEK